MHMDSVRSKKSGSDDRQTEGPSRNRKLKQEQSQQTLQSSYSSDSTTSTPLYHPTIVLKHL